MKTSVKIFLVILIWIAFHSDLSISKAIQYIFTITLNLLLGIYSLSINSNTNKSFFQLIQSSLKIGFSFSLAYIMSVGVSGNNYKLLLSFYFLGWVLIIIKNILIKNK